MSIIKRRKRNTAFVQINRDAIADKRLSWKAKGLLAYLLSLPDDWQIYVSELLNHTTDKKHTTSKAMQELIENKYIQRLKIRKADSKENKGHFKGYEYIVDDIPMSEIIDEAKSKNTESRNTDVGNTESRNTDVGNTESRNTDVGKSATINKHNTNKHSTNKNNTSLSKEASSLEEIEKEFFAVASNETLNKTCTSKNPNAEDPKKVALKKGVFGEYERWLHGLYAQGRFECCTQFEIQPSNDYLAKLINDIDRSGVVKVLENIEEYCKKNPSYCKKRKTLSRIMTKFKEGIDTPSVARIKKAVDRAFQSEFGESYIFQSNSSKHIKKIFVTTINIRNKSGLDIGQSSVLSDIEHVFKNLPSKYKRVDQFKIEFIASSWQQIRMQVLKGNVGYETANSKAGDVKKKHEDFDLDEFINA